MPTLGLQLSYFPMNAAKRNSVKWVVPDSDEPSYVGVTGVELDIVGQASLWVAFSNLKEAKELKVLISRQEAEEILIDLDRPQAEG